jgi:hypothetical protein
MRSSKAGPIDLLEQEQFNLVGSHDVLHSGLIADAD